MKNKKIRSFLDVIAICEGTKKNNKSDTLKLPMLEEYQVSFLNTKKITNLNHYPNKLFCNDLRGKPVCASAAGRYQFIKATWQRLQKKYDQKIILNNYENEINNFFNNKGKYYDKSITNLYQEPQDLFNYQFGPFWQDFYAIIMLIEGDIIEPIMNNKYEEIFKKASKIWSTIPVNQHHGSRYPSYINRAQKYQIVLEITKKYLNKKKKRSHDN